MPDIGTLGEQVVAEWLQTQGWVILHHRWRCRWGEIDLIAQQEDRGKEGARENHPGTFSSLLAFVEVKTRSKGNWDADGALAITPQKQAKIWRTAELFLAEHPDFANLPCQFDVALVNCQRLSQHSRHKDTVSSLLPGAIDKAIQVPPVQLGQPVLVAEYQLILQHYIQSAFESISG